MKIDPGFFVKVYSWCYESCDYRKVEIFENDGSFLFICTKAHMAEVWTVDPSSSEGSKQSGVMRL